MLFIALSTRFTAQVEQGTIPIGGNFILSKTTIYDDYESFSTSFGPSIGYFFTDNFGVGGSYFYNGSWVDIRNFPIQGRDYAINIQRHNFSLYARGYFNFLDYRIFGQNTIRYESYTNSVAAAPNDELSSFQSKLELGANAFFNTNIAVEGAIKFTYLKYESASEKTKLGSGPLEIQIDVRPFLIDRGGKSAYFSDEYLDQGGWNIGGVIYFRHSLESRDNASISVLSPNFLEISASPKVGFFILPGLLLGTNVIAGYRDDLVNNPINFTIAPYIRYYLRATEGLQVVPNFQGSYSFLMTRQRGNDLKNESTEFAFVPGIGLHTFIADGIGLFANGMLQMRRRPKGVENYTNPRVINSLQAQVGLEFYISSY